MNKEWFIFGNDSHVGPFAREEILQMFEEEKIYESTLLWREGDEEWLPLDEITEFNSDVVRIKNAPQILPDIPVSNSAPELPELPELPDLPVEVDEDNVQQIEPERESIFEIEEVVEETEEVELPKKKPESVIEIETEAIQDLGPQIEEVHIEKKQSLETTKEDTGLDRLVSWLKYTSESSAVIGACTLVVGLGLLMSLGLFSSNSSDSLKLKNVSVSQITKLNEVINDSDQRVKAYFAVTRDLQSLYLGINRLSAMSVTAHFKSVDGQVKSLTPVVFEASGKIENGLAHMNLLKFKRGTKIRAGLYKVNILGHGIGNDSKLRPFKDLKFVGKQLVYSGKAQDFEVELDAFITSEKDKKNSVYKDLIERANTLNSFIDMTYDEYEEVLSKAFKGKNILKFEEYFIQKISPIFKEIVLEINRNILNLQQANDPKVALFEKLHENYQIFGELVGDMVVETNKKKWIRKKERQTLKAKFSKEIKALKGKNQNLIKDIEKNLI